MRNDLAALIFPSRGQSNIQRSIKSLEGFDRLLMINSGDHQDIHQITRGVKAEVVSITEADLSEQWRRLFSLVNTEWVLFLYDDEALCDELRTNLIAFAPPADVDGYYLRRRHYFSGKLLKHSGWKEDWQLRLFRKSWAEHHRIPNTIASTPDPDGRTRKFPWGHIAHHLADNIEPYLSKLIREALIEAEARYRRGERVTVSKLVCDLLAEFLRFYVHHQGFRDGWRGYALAQLMAWYKFAADAGVWEKSRPSVKSERQGDG